MSNLKILNHGYRVSWRKYRTSEETHYTIYYPTLEKAEYIADTIRQRGDYVVQILNKEESQS